MQVHQSIAAEIPADSSSLLGRFGEYEIYPLQVCNEEQISVLFSQVCQRGNPLLQGRPIEDLILLGRAFYRKCLPLGMSQVALYNGEPVALMCAWDVAEGGVWKNSGFSVPDSMDAHAEVGKACFAKLEGEDSRVFFSAFGGVNRPHNGKLFGLMGLIGMKMAKASGFKKSFQYSVLEKSVLARTKGNKSLAQSKVHKVFDPVLFADIAAQKEATRAELKELNGISKMSLVHLSFMTSDYYIPAIAAAVKATPEELKESAFPMAEKQLELLQGRTGVSTSSAPISKL